jgi:hypothetical protein
MKDKLLPHSKFPWILGASALFIAVCAAFFSVYGISTLFAGAFLSVVIMASSLEVSKLVGVTFLYRYWSKCKLYLKFYLSLATIVLMIITSLGIFGYLSAAYQKSSIEFAATQEKIKATETQKVFYQDKIVASKQRIDALIKIRASQEARMSEVITNEFLTRNPLQLKQLQQQTIDLIAVTDKDMKEENDKIQGSIDEIQKIDNQVNQLKLGTAEKKDVQIFKFVADALGSSLDKVARWFILMIIFVFDPLAVGLILAYNVAVYRKEDERVFDKISESAKIEEQKPIEIKTQTIPAITEKKIDKVLSVKSNPSNSSTPKSSNMSDFFRQMFKI